jgi:hypothetical protein
MKKGDRIRKINSKPGDGHQDGDQGIIHEVFDVKQMMIQAGATPEQADEQIKEFVEKEGIKEELISVMYSVYWDDLPKVPVMVSGSRVELAPL